MLLSQLSQQHKKSIGVFFLSKARELKFSWEQDQRQPYYLNKLHLVQSRPMYQNLSSGFRNHFTNSHLLLVLHCRIQNINTVQSLVYRQSNNFVSKNSRSGKCLICFFVYSILCLISYKYNHNTKSCLGTISKSPLTTYRITKSQYDFRLSRFSAIHQGKALPPPMIKSDKLTI